MGHAKHRIAEIAVTAGEGTAGAYGSGYLLTRRLILTSRHVVESALPEAQRPPPSGEESLTEWLRSGRASSALCEVRMLTSPVGSPYAAARVVWSDSASDVALVAVDDEAWQQPQDEPVGWLDLATADVVACSATGFPALDRDDAAGTRDSRQIVARIAPFTGDRRGVLAVSVDLSIGQGALLSGSAWAGMSGAAVWVKDSIAGVIRSDVDASDATRLELLATPARAFAADHEFVAWLAADASPGMWRQRSATFLEQRTSAEAGLLRVPGEVKHGLIGRQEQLAQIQDRLQTGDNVALSGGVPGLGKRALAVTVARGPLASEYFPDGCFWLPVGRVGPGGLTHWVHRMSFWAEHLGVPADQIAAAQTHEDGPKLAGLVHEALGERRVLLVFDDVWTPEDANVFHSMGARCQRLMTTRIPAAAAEFAVEPILVPELGPDDALRLMESVSPGAEQLYGDDLVRAVERLAGLPQAITLVGGTIRRMRPRGEQKVRAFLRAIGEKGGPLDIEVLDADYQGPPIPGGELTLRAVIAVATDHLSDGNKDALRSLTVFPPKANSFSNDAAVFVSGNESRVDALAEGGLLDLAAERGPRWSIHQSIVDAVSSGSGDDESCRRMTQFLAQTAELRSAGGEGDWTGEVEQESENVRAALEWTVRAGDSFLGLRLMSALWKYWYERSYFERGRSLAQRILDIPMGDRPDAQHQLLRAKVLNDCANFAYNMGDLSSAETQHDEAMAIRTERGEEALTASSLNNLALVYRERGDYDRALTNLRRAREINLRTQHPSWRSWAAMNDNNIGITLDRLGRYDEAVEAQRSSEQRFAELKDAWGLAMSRTDLAMAQISAGQVELARLALEGVIEERLPRGDVKRVSSAARGLAEIALLAHESPRAQDLLLAALTYSTPIADVLGQVDCLVGLVAGCASTEDVILSGSAAGVLEVYQARSGCVLAPRRAEQLLAARAALTADGARRFEEARLEAAQAAAAGATVWTALGLSGPVPSPELAVDGSSHPHADAVSG